MISLAQSLRSLRSALLLAALFTLTACSLARLAYNNFGSVVAYAVNDYVDLTPEQEELLKTRAASLVAWHREKELPQWLRTLENARARVGAGASEADVRAAQREAQTLIERTAERMLPDAAELLARLEPAQIARLAARLEKDNRKVARETAVPADERRAKRVKRVLGHFEEWMGTLTPDQISWLRSRVMAWPLLDEMRLDDRRRWQREFLQLLETRPEPRVFQAELRALVLNAETRRDPAYQAAWARQQADASDLAAWMVANATPAQRTRIQKKLAGYAEDLTALMRAT